MYRDFHRHKTPENMNLQAPKYEPDEAAALALLQYLEKEQLEQYLNEPNKIDELIGDLHQMKTIQKDRENVTVKNRSVAEFTMSLKPNFEALKQQVATAYEEVNNLKVKLCEDVAKLELAPGCQSSPDVLLAIFQTEAATADEQSEQVAESFCDGDIDVETFISSYIPQRTEAYLRKAKLEKVGDLLRQRGSVSTSVPYSASSVTENSYTKQYSAATSSAYRATGYDVGSTPYPSTSGPGLYGGMPLPSHYQR